MGSLALVRMSPGARAETAVPWQRSEAFLQRALELTLRIALEAKLETRRKERGQGTDGDSEPMALELALALAMAMAMASQTTSTASWRLGAALELGDAAVRPSLAMALLPSRCAAGLAGVPRIAANILLAGSLLAVSRRSI